MSQDRAQDGTPNAGTDGPVEMHGPRAHVHLPADPGSPVEMHGPHRQAHPHRVSGRMRRRLVGALLVAIAVAGVAAGVGMLTGFLPNPVVAGDSTASGRGEPPSAVPTVKVIRPKRDPSFRMSVQRIATVEPFYQANLRAEAVGVVRYVAKDIGEPVRTGELLVEIEAPDLQQAVAQKEAMIQQRQRELAVAQAEEVVARGAVQAAAVAVRQKEVEVAQMKDLRAARKIDLDQIMELYNRGSVVKDRLNASEFEYQAAQRAVEAAEAAVEQAKVEQSGKTASLEKATADIELKRALVEVARKDRDIAAARLDYTRVYAPFDGVIVARATDPGKFVQGLAEPLVTVARVDLVTVVMKLPDDAAGFVTPTTEAVVEFPQLPGVTVRGPVTRYSPYIDPNDRSMRVEVDVYNGSVADYRRMLGRMAAQTTVPSLIPLDPRAATAAAGSGMIRSRLDAKGWSHGMALCPEAGATEGGAGAAYRQILPGMSGVVRVYLDKLTDAYILPAGAVYRKAGQSYLLMVEDGETREVPASVQLNDGRLVKVAVLESVSGRPVARELTGNEVVVAARQLEVGDGQRVEAVAEQW